MGTLDRTWALYKQSFRVLSADAEILVFPVLSTAGTLLVAASFFVPLHVDWEPVPHLIRESSRTMTK